MTPVQMDDAWDRFYDEFLFKPNYYERILPAIHEPDPSITFDLSCEWTDQFVDEMAQEFLKAFRAVTPPGEQLYFLDWQHQCYLFEPHLADTRASVPVLPDGDYHLFLDPEFRFGTFGHPWQQSLTVFGTRLLEALGEPTRVPAEMRRTVGRQV